jgi:cytochrome c
LCAAAGAALAAGCGTRAAPSPNDDLALGERAYQKCYSCHALEREGEKLQGPSLHQIVGRRIAAEAGFAYSPALRAFAQRQPRWTPELLERYVADPEALVPRTSMTFHGISDAKERRALVEYLARAGR